MNDALQCLGIDFGATKVRAVRVEAGEAGLSSIAEAMRVHTRTSEFEAVDFARQRAEALTPQPTRAERASAEVWVESAAACVRELRSSSEAVIGVAAPGLKTSDGRGTAVVRRGPRIPDLLDRLLERLSADGPVVAPTGALHGDGECSVRGEVVHERGGLRGVSTGLYVGGGTGVAEGLWRDGRVHACEPRAWELAAREGVDHERLLAMDALRAELGDFPDRAWANGDARAADDFRLVAGRLARLVAARWSDDLEAVVLGQRFGDWFLRDEWASVYRAPLLDELRALRGSAAVACVRGSDLVAAPAVGAAWLALREVPAC